MQAEYSNNPGINLDEPGIDPGEPTGQYKVEQTHTDQTSIRGSRPDSRKKKEKREYQGQMLNRWPRAFARLFDLAWEVPLVLFGLMLVAPNFSSGPAQTIFFLFLSLPLALLLDGVIAGVFTNTPAKALIGVKATTSRGERLHLATHVRRNFAVWTDGLALGIVPISLFSMYKQFKRVSGRREANYDERLHVRVRSGRMTAIRVLIPLFLLIGSFAVLLLTISQ